MTWTVGWIIWNNTYRGHWFKIFISTDSTCFKERCKGWEEYTFEPFDKNKHIYIPFKAHRIGLYVRCFTCNYCYSKSDRKCHCSYHQHTSEGDLCRREQRNEPEYSRTWTLMGPCRNFSTRTTNQANNTLITSVKLWHFTLTLCVSYKIVSLSRFQIASIGLLRSVGSRSLRSTWLRKLPEHSQKILKPPKVSHKTSRTFWNPLEPSGACSDRYRPSTNRKNQSHKFLRNFLGANCATILLQGQIGCHHAWADSPVNVSAWQRRSICIGFWQECGQCCGATKMWTFRFRIQ